MTELLVFTHLAAAGLGALAVLLLLKPHLNEGDKTVASFKSILDDIGDGLKKFFTSPVVADITADGIDLAEIAWPALTPLLNGVKASIAKAQTLAAAANITGDSTAEVSALVLADAQSAFQAYGTATGKTVETAQQTQFINLFLSLLGSLPSSSTPAAPAPAPAPVAAVSAITAAVQTVVTAPAPAPAPVPGLQVAE